MGGITGFERAVRKDVGQCDKISNPVVMADHGCGAPSVAPADPRSSI